MKEQIDRVFGQVKPSPEQKEAMLSRLLKSERSTVPMKKLRKLVVAGVAAALMVISCAAAVVTGLDQRLLDYFGAESEEDAGLIAPAAVAINQSHTYETGWTVEISQVLADRLSLAVLVDVTAPEGTVLSKEERLSLRLDHLDSRGERISGHILMGFIRQLEDGDPTDNHMTVLWQVHKTQGEESVPYIGGSLKVTPCGVGFLEGDRVVPTEFNTGDTDTWWSCTVKLPDTDPGVTYSMDQPLSIGEAQVRLTGVYLSPLSLTVYVEDEEEALRAPEGDDPEKWEEYRETAALKWVDNVLLNMADGTQIAAAESQGQVVGVSYTLCFDRILNPEEVVSVTLFGQTYELK